MVIQMLHGQKNAASGTWIFDGRYYESLSCRQASR